MTQRDRWKKRPCVERYWAYKDQIRDSGLDLPDSGFHVVFVIPMPKSWSKKKRELMRGCPHQQKPDKDNLEKGLLDAVLDEDCRVWDSRVTKIWGDEGRIRISMIEQEGRYA
jgi:Holliday junction resolvase RusA-like endonuclease